MLKNKSVVVEIFCRRFMLMRQQTLLGLPSWRKNENQISRYSQE